jgi:hypothetical protein
MKRAIQNVTLTFGHRIGRERNVPSKSVFQHRRVDSPRELLFSAAHGFNNFADCINHELLGNL